MAPNCVYRWYYGNNEDCTISFGGTFTLTAYGTFGTEECCDKITVYPSGAQYSGTTGPNNVLASYMTWTTDYAIAYDQIAYPQYDGWYICAS